MPSYSFSAESDGEKFGGQVQMNGHRLDQYKDFEKNWKLVTVRYRKDTGEMRFTYANGLAYKTLKKGLTDYPDGAVFAKIGLKTNEDPSFASSVVPAGARRYQFMVRNKKKYKDNNGWDYALFDERGLTFPEDPKTQVVACAACHNIVPERGYVFSQLIELHPNSVASIVKNGGLPQTFKMIDVTTLPKNISSLIPEEIKYVRVLEGELRKKLFQGTLEEIRPSLFNEVEKSKLPAILYNEDGSRFSLVLPENLGSNCKENDKIGIFMHSIYTKLDKNNEKQELHFCFTH